MPLEITEIPISGYEAHIGALKYLAVVAYPKKNKDFNFIKKRDGFVKAGIAWMVKQDIKNGVKRKNYPKEFREYRYEKIDGAFDQVSNRLERRRMPAVQIMQAIIMHQPPMIQTWASSLTQASKKMHIFIHDKFGCRSNADPSTPNFKDTRDSVFKESIPVLHLAWALKLYLDSLRSNSKDQYPTDLYNLISSANDWIEPTLNHAEQLRNHMLNMKKLEYFKFDYEENETIQLVAT